MIMGRIAFLRSAANSWLQQRAYEDSSSTLALTSTELIQRQTFSITEAETVSFNDPSAILSQVYAAFELGSNASVSRREALTVPAVRSVDRLLGQRLATFPLVRLDSKKERRPSPLLDQLEAHCPTVNTLAKTYRDLVFDNVAYWLVTERDFQGYPTKVKHLACNRVQVQDTVVYLDGRRLSNPQDLVIFYGPNESGLLKDGARAIRTLILLDKTAALYAASPLPNMYFQAQESAEDPEDTEIQDALDAWAVARRTNATGWVPSGIQIKQLQGFTADEIQLSDARAHAVLEIARLSGIDAEELSVSTTSRTYANIQDRRIDYVNNSLASYIQVVEGRLSMGDITPINQYVKANLSSYLKANVKERYETYQMGLEAGFLTLEEIRDLEDRPQLIQKAATE